MRELAERAYFVVCRTLGRLLRSARYSKTRIVRLDGELRVRKHRSFHAPLLIRMSRPLMWMLDGGVRILPQREWEERERRHYQVLHGAPIRIDAGGTLVLPRLAGAPLATLLGDPALEPPVRRSAIAMAVVALAELHRLGLTHGDAMAENVMVDLEREVAGWIDFETVHDSSRPMVWRRADDVRALLATCLVRTAPESLADTVHLVLDVYRDDGVVRELTASFGSALRRPLAFHLGQAGLSYRCFRKIARVLRERDSRPRSSPPPRRRGTRRRRGR